MAVKNGSQKSKSPSQLIDARIKELGDWRGKMLSRLRALVKEADPEVVEEWKWRGVPVWSHDGMICTGETYKNVVKMTFAKGAALKDPSGLFNSSLDGNTRRAIDFHEGEQIDEEALKTLVRAAVTLNKSKTVQSQKLEHPADYPSVGVTIALGESTISLGESTMSLGESSGSSAAARFLASFLTCFSCRRSISLRSRLSFAIVVFLFPLEAMLDSRPRALGRSRRPGPWCPARRRSSPSRLRSAT